MHQNSQDDFSLKKLFVPLTAHKAICVIVIVGSITFFNSFFNGFVGDDGSQSVGNPAVHSILNIPHLFTGSTFYSGDMQRMQGSYYRPVMSSLFAIVYTLFGPHAPAFHIFQVTIHIINSILIFFIFRFFLKPAISIILALIFLLDTINSETVVYISNLQDISFFFFGNLALYLNLRMKESYKRIFLVSLLLLLSLFSKETGVLFIVTLIIYEFLFQKNNIRKALLIGLVVIVIYAFFRVFIAHITYTKETYAPIMNLLVAERLLNVPSIVLYYLKTAFLPIHLAISQQWIVNSQNISEFYLALLIDVILIVVLFLVGQYIYHKHKNYLKPYLFFIFWLIIGLFFHSQIFFALNSTVADRWFYFPIVGLLGIIGVLLQTYVANTKAISKFSVILVVIILGSLSVRTIIRNANFSDNYTLYSHDIRYSKDSSKLENGLGYELTRQGRYEEAENHLLRSVQLDPKGHVNWTNLGNLYVQTGRIKNAREAYFTAIRNSDFYVAYQTLALFLFLYDNPESAEKFTRESLQKFPRNGTLWQYHALIEHSLGHADEALLAARQAVLHSPSNLTYIIYNRLSQNQSLELNIIPTKKGKMLEICPPACR